MSYTMGQPVNTLLNTGMPVGYQIPNTLAPAVATQIPGQVAGSFVAPLPVTAPPVALGPGNVPVYPPGTVIPRAPGPGDTLPAQLANLATNAGYGTLPDTIALPAIVQNWNQP